MLGLTITHRAPLKSNDPTVAMTVLVERLTLSVAELALLAAHTAMKGNIFEQRKKQQAKMAKRKQAEVVIPNGEDQIRQVAEQQRVKRELDAERAERSEEVREKQRKQAELRRQKLLEESAAERAALAQAAKKQNDDEEYKAANPAARKGPSNARRAGQVAPPPGNQSEPLPVKILPDMPQFLDPPNMDEITSVTAGRTPQTPVDREAIKTFVRTNIDLAILCAPYPDGRVRTWNELAAPAPDSAFYGSWMEWNSPAKWVEIPRKRYEDNTLSLEPVTDAGNYNEVLKITANTPLDDPSSWPPQLLASGVPLDQSVAAVDKLPQNDYVVRMTRMTPFPLAPGSTRPLQYRSMKLDHLVGEMAMALDAAAQGIGPPIYAATAWPWERQPGDTQQKYGMILIMLKSDGDLQEYQQLVRIPADPVTGPSPIFRRTVEESAHYLVGMCWHVGWTQHINFDIKPGNILMHKNKDQFYLADFDAVYYVYVPPEVASARACMFVNLLLLAMHIQSYFGSGTYISSTMRVFGPVLMQLWKEIVDSGSAAGPGQTWLQEARISPISGSFDLAALRAIPDAGARLGRQLSMMVFEYLFDKSDGKQPPMKALNWSWNVESAFFSGGYPLLLPQLLRYSILFNKAVPTDWVRFLQ
mgnify:CR=1 FL=1